MTLSTRLIAATDTCVEDGGTAICIGPVIGPYRYQVGSYFPGPPGQGDTEEEAVNAQQTTTK